MIITRDIRLLNNTAVALGVFDGVHKAHKVLIGEAVSYAKNNNIKSLVFAFDNNYKTDNAIVSNEKKSEIINALGADILFCVSLDEKLKNTSYSNFLEKYLKNCSFICVGFNFRFGKDRKGDVNHIISFCKENNIAYKIIDEIKDNGETVSSTLIREYIKECDFASAKALLGRDFSVSGTVIKGDEMGKGLGFPTINIENDSRLLQNGVYATNTVVEGKTYKSVTNVGGKPTIRDNVSRIETHILDFNKDIYGSEVEIQFIKKIRDIIKFDNIENLTLQVKKDIAIRAKL